MSVVKRHDVIQTGLYIASEKKELHKLEEGRGGWSEMPSRDREILMEVLHKIEVNSIRQHANLAIDHQKLLKAEFNDMWTATVGTVASTWRLNKQPFRGPHVELNLETSSSFGSGSGDDSQDTSNYISIISLTPSSINGFNAMKRKYQYFKINKISVKFVSNSAQNLAPIICRYMPPMGKDVDYSKLSTDYITKYAESNGTQCGFLSVHVPPCLVKRGEYDQNNAFQYGDNGFCIPNVNKDRMLCSYADDKFYLDYGSFVFENKNIGSQQNIIAQIHYYIDFYTGYDYDSAGAAIGDFDGDGEPDAGNDVPGSAQILPPRGCYKRSFKPAPTKK